MQIQEGNLTTTQEDRHKSKSPSLLTNTKQSIYNKTNAERELKTSHKLRERSLPLKNTILEEIDLIVEGTENYKEKYETVTELKKMNSVRRDYM